MLISDPHFISNVSNINQLFKIIVAKSSLHFLSQLVCHGLITVLVLFMNQLCLLYIAGMDTEKWCPFHCIKR